MGLFSFLTVKTKTGLATDVVAQRVLCDSSKTAIITELFQIPQPLRGNAWLREFYNNVKTAAFTNGDPETLKGPDGFTYFVLRTQEACKHADSFCIQNMKDEFIMDKGFGIVINPNGNMADWVFSHGDIINLHLNDDFVSEDDNTGLENIEMTKKVGVIKQGEDILMAQPSENYLPKKTRSLLKLLLQSKGVKRPMVALLCRKVEGLMQQQLVFNVFPEDFGATERDAIMQEITWFLPRHYSIISFSRSSIMSRNFNLL